MYRCISTCFVRDIERVVSAVTELVYLLLKLVEDLHYHITETASLDSSKLHLLQLHELLCYLEVLLHTYKCRDVA